MVNEHKKKKKKTKKKRGENLEQWTACWEGREKKMRKGDRLFGQK